MAATTRYLGTCAACGGEFKVRDGRLVHHGYKRPGIGYIVGDCMGVDYPPHELSPELAERVLGVAIQKAETAEAQLARLPERTKLPKQFYESPGPGLRAQWVTRQVAPDDVSEHEWRQLYAAAQARLERELRFWQSEIRRAQGSLKGWRKQPLRTVEEEQAQQRAAKSEREAAKLAKWQAQAEAKVAYYQRKMDSALTKLAKPKDPREASKAARAIRDLYTDAAGKVREAMRGHITYDQAQAMLDFGEVWDALGVPPPSSDWRTRNVPIERWYRAYLDAEQTWLASPERYAQAKRPKRFVKDRPTNKNVFAVRDERAGKGFWITYGNGPTNYVREVGGLIDPNDWLDDYATEALNTEIEADPDAPHWAIPILFD